MNFIKKIITNKNFCVIDIGSYKVKALICEYKSGELKVLGYGEKRQEKTDIIQGEISNIQGVSDTIFDALFKASKEAGITPKDIIINIPTSQITSTSNKINYLRKSHNEVITNDELDYIVGKIESKAIHTSIEKIKNTTGYTDVDIKLITSSITRITIDGTRVSNPIGFTGKNITIEVLNIFIPQSKYHTIKTIGSDLNKNILSIVPLEFSIPKILDSTEYNLENILFLDIGNTRTRIIIQKQGSIIGFNRMDIGINDLIKDLSNKYNIIGSKIIEDIDKEKYDLERIEFLDIWIEGVILSIKDIIKDDIVPHHIFLSGGGDNKFLRDFLKNLDLNKYGLKTLRTFDFIYIDLEKTIPIYTDQKFKNKTNINILSLALACKEIIENNKKPITESLKKIIEKLDI